MASTAPPKTGLLDLPSEIASKIYGYVFDDFPATISPARYARKWINKPSPGILGVCRRTRIDALPVIRGVFKETTVCLDGTDLETTFLQAFGECFEDACITVGEDANPPPTTLLPNLKKLILDYTCFPSLWMFLDQGESKESWLEDDPEGCLADYWKGVDDETLLVSSRRYLQHTDGGNLKFQVIAVATFDHQADYDGDELVSYDDHLARLVLTLVRRQFS
jgi:hypothetical protein